MLHAGTIFCTLAVWWASTGVVLRAGGLPHGARRPVLAGAVLALAIGLGLVVASRGEGGVAEVALGFTGAVLAWGFIETGFLTGSLTGPQRAACPPGLAGSRRLSRAIGVVLYHDLAILAGAVLVPALAGGVGTTAGGTFLILAVMRVSAQLNLFLGVPNRAEDMLPAHLAYVATYFRDRPMNPLLPLSVTAGTVLAAGLAFAAGGAEANDGQAVRATLLATLLGLAVLEHWFLVLPIPVGALWRGPARTDPARDHEAGPDADPLFCAVRNPLTR